MSPDVADEAHGGQAVPPEEYPDEVRRETTVDQLGSDGAAGGTSLGSVLEGDITREGLPLVDVQRWLVDQIMGQSGGPATLPVTTVEQVLAPSRALSAADRLAVYQHAYTARLLEVLREDYTVLCRALGNELFDRFALEYLRQHPSTSYTLGRLGDRFVAFLEQSRPPRGEAAAAGPDWSDAILDLARLEAVVNRVFDGPGEEDRGPLPASVLQGLTAERFAGARLHLSASLVFVSLRFPLQDYFTALVRGEQPGLPEPAEEVVAVWRRNYRVHRLSIDPAPHRLLSLLQEGQTVGEALGQWLQEWPELAPDLGSQLSTWFHEWTQRGWIVQVEAPGLVSPTSG